MTIRKPGFKHITVCISRYLTIEGESYPTYIPNFLWGPILVRLGGAMGTYIAHPNILKWEHLAAGQMLIA